MTQHDLEFADQLFPEMRVDMNTALIAHSTRQSGPGAPPLVAAARPNRLYVHDVSGLVFARDNADTTDFVWDTWARDKVRNVTASPDTLLALDMNGVVTYSSATAIAVTLPEAVGNFAAAWNTMLWNFGPGEVTVTPTTSQINGVGSLLLRPGQSAEIFSKAGHFWAFKRVAEDKAPVLTGSLITSFAAAMTGYVMLDGRTIGNAASGATNRANADTVDLYTLLWNNISQTWAPVGGGRGASAAADYAANKVLTLPDASGATLRGRDNMSGAARGRLTAAGCSIDGNVLGFFGGSQFVQNHAHPANDPGHAHGIPGTALAPGGGGATVVGGPGFPFNVSTSGTGISIGAYGSGGHQNVSPTLIANVFCKL